MPETLAALLFAHVLADFVFQTNRMVEHKQKPLVLGIHFAIVYATLLVATGSIHPALLALALVHIGIDVGKLALSAALKGRHALGLFLVDQAFHIVSLMTLAAFLPDLWAQGLWAAGAVVADDGGILGTGLWSETVVLPISHLPALMVLVTGFIIATRAGGFAVSLLMDPFAPHLGPGDAEQSLPGAGRVIGQLERGLIFALVLFGQAQGVGLLIAAKSILRFGAVKDDRRLSEYVIIGTLASFGWALVVAYATLAGLAAFPPLGFPATTP